MRAFILLLAVVLLFAVVGWISFSKGPDRSSINLETGEIRQDTKQAMQSGAELLHKAGDEMQTQANRPAEPTPTNPEPQPATPY